MTRRSVIRRKARQPILEGMEDRVTPATFGVPWYDPSHLTLSFVPDGTPIAGHASGLFQTLNALKPTADWQRDVLQAFQTWAVNANINIGLVADGGQAMGATGLSQHDARFGDVRVGAQPMASDALSISVPNDPSVTSTLGGDVLVNALNEYQAKSLDLFSIVLHEAGHVFGLDHSSDPNSPLFSSYTGANKLTSADVAALQALYGVRASDSHEGSGGNNGVNSATTIQPPGSYTGATPLVAYGDVGSSKDVDVFAFRAPSGYTGPATIRLQSAGISLLAPRLTLLDAKGNTLADVQASSGMGDIVTLTLPKVDANTNVYFRVQGATKDVFGIGGYGVAVTFDARNTIGAAAIDQVLRGPYQALNPNDLDALFFPNASPLFNNDRGADDAIAKATTLDPSPGYARNAHYEVLASLSSTSDSDFYRIQTADSPKNSKSLVLTVTLRAASVNGAAPRVSLLDSDGAAVPASILANGNGTYTVQAVGVKPGGYYFLQVGPQTAAGSASVGNYSLTAQFGAAAAQLTDFAAATFATPEQTAAYHFYVGETQLMNLLLAASSAGAAAPDGTSVRMTIFDAAGNVVHDLQTSPGDVVSGPAILVTPGAYTIRIATLAPAGLTAPPMSYRLFGSSISDPIGPVLNDPTLTPSYDVPGLPGMFLYPGDILTAIGFIVVEAPPPSSSPTTTTAPSTDTTLDPPPLAL